jgi:oligopeptide transport system substrate-binding protein
LFSVLGLALCGTLALTSCGSSSNTANDGIITTYNTEPENPLIPGNTTEVGGGDPIDVMFSGLISYSSAGEPVNEVADAIETTDNQNFTVKLKDWKWSDGTDLVAEDFVNTWNFTANLKNGQLCSSFFDQIKGFDAVAPQDDAAVDALTGQETMEGLKVIDDKTFTIELSAPSSTFELRLGMSAFYPVPHDKLSDINAFGENPVSNGPFKLSAWNHNVDLELVPNENYKGDRVAKNKGVTFKFYTDPDAGYTAVQSGDLDIMDTVPNSHITDFKTDDSLVGRSDPSSLFEMFSIPEYIKHFGNDEEGKLRRQAISMAIDRQTAIDKILNGTAKAATSFSAVTDQINGSTDDVEGNDVLKYNPEKAKELWAQADQISKWEDTDVFKISFNADGGAQQMYEAICNSIANTLGIDAQPDSVVDFKTLRQSANAKTLQYAIRDGWQPDYPSIENYLQPMVASNGSSNDSDYSSPEVDKLLQEGSQATSLDEANKYFTQAQAVLMKDLPYIPVYSRNVNSVIGKNVQNYALTWKGVPDYVNISK